MTTSDTKLTYYNGWWWSTTLLADGTWAVQPSRAGSGAARATTRYYRKPIRAHS